ncbi:Ubiquitin-conjugating enzyme E2,Ubiquitin-conjugating enzyme/RWD-like [Cinara cedri]|uniref:Ubiquitin-conjugating enzyme E2,Ubiquitin-conjugating enzyme/RWD-like n=1 Tax=Cinara cedri TaxID=506608 RepID=A0A5E4MG92_9HEMI|nr:Ubiquitin-conjugating enzyme E2,Ubiquitin-conjugating enzyme/RWD-like [Cinara cedri]
MSGNNDEVFHRTGSFRRVIPPGNDTTGISGIPVKSNNRNNSYINANYIPFFLEYTLMSEFNILSKKLLPGVYVIPAAKTPFIWFGVIFPRYGLYKNGAFRFLLHIDSNWPDCECPKVIIETPIFHPLVDPVSGEMSIQHHFPEWKKGVSRIWHVIDHVLKSFYDISSTKTPANPEAANLFKTDKDNYIKKCEDCVKQSQIEIYNQPNNPENDDPNYLHFDHYNEETHGSIRRTWLQQKECDNRIQPLSWVQPGSLEPFSRPHT